MPSKEYHQSKSKEHYARNRDYYLKRTAQRRDENRKIINEAKSVGCLVCSEAEICCLDFHHLDPSGKDKNVAMMFNYKKERLIDEINKCVVLCRNCHAKVHAGIIALDRHLAQQVEAADLNPAQ